MYTEVKELVNFLARYLIGKLPRRPASLFTCQLANFLVCRYREHKWDVEDPTKDEQHRVVRSKVVGFTDQLIISAATEIGLCVDEVLESLPDNILIFANPGEVFYRAGENAAAVPIWSGEKGVDPDITYSSLPSSVTNPPSAASLTPPSNMGAAGRPFYVGRSRKTDSVIDLEDAYVQLKLEPVQHSNSDDNMVLPQSNLMMFSYTPKNHTAYMIKEFAATRFGCHRQRLDHDVMKRIQRQAATRGMEIAAATSSSDSSSSTSHPLSLESGDAAEVTSANTSLAIQLHSSSVEHTRDATTCDIETLETLTNEQREALVNIIRKSSVLDQSLSRLQQALTKQPIIHVQNSGHLRSNKHHTTQLVIKPTLKVFPVPHYGPIPITVIPMVAAYNSGKYRSGLVSNVASYP